MIYQKNKHQKLIVKKSLCTTKPQVRCLVFFRFKRISKMLYKTKPWMISSINLKTVTDFIFYNERKSPTETSIISWAQFFLNCKSHYLHCRPRLLHFMEYPVCTVYFFTRDIFQGSPQSRYPNVKKSDIFWAYSTWQGWSYPCGLRL